MNGGARRRGRGFDHSTEGALALPLPPSRAATRTAVSVCAFLLLALYPPPLPGEAATRRGLARVPTISAAGSRCWTWKAPEKSFKRKLNDARRSRSLVPLRFDPELSKVARVHTREMVRSANLHHTPSDAFRQRVTNWNVLGENVGVGSTPSSLHVAFMNSPAHRDNVLYRTYRYLGIGTARGNGRLWVTVVFEEDHNPGTRLSMPGC